MASDVFIVLLAVVAAGVALTLGLALVVGLQGRTRAIGRRNSAGGRADRPRMTAAPDESAPADDSVVEDPAHPHDGAQTWGSPETRDGHDMADHIDRVELAAHAEQAARRAEWAATAVGMARRRYREREARRAAIEAEYDEAQAEYAAALRAVREGRGTPPTEEDLRRVHEVSAAALAAFRRGELSEDQLRAVFARAADRDPAQEAREREAERFAARLGRVRRAYDIAVSAVRLAGEHVHVAEVAAEATTQEAVDAAIDVELAAQG